MAWVVIRVTEEAERKDVDSYVDFEGFADVEKVKERLGWAKKTTSYEWNRVVETLVLHILTEVDWDESDEEGMKTWLRHVTEGICYVFGGNVVTWSDGTMHDYQKRRTAWMTEDHE